MGNRYRIVKQCCSGIVVVLKRRCYDIVIVLLLYIV